MRAFSLIALVLLLASATPIANAQASAVVAAINSLTAKSDQLNTLTNGINLVNVLFQGPRVGQGLVAIANDAYQGTQMLSSMQPLNNADATLVVDALRTFVQVHQRLLSTIIGKHGLLSLFFFTEPVRVALVQLEAAVDSLAFALIEKIPTQAPAATAQFNSLGLTVTQAIQVYSEGPAGTPNVGVGRKLLK